MTDRPQNRRLFTLKNKRSMPAWLASPLAVAVRLWRRTCRVRVVDPRGLYDAGRFPVILAAWHNRLPLLAGLLRRDMRQRVAVLVSASRDGNYGAAVAARLGFLPVRGSSSKGGMAALRAMLRELADGHAAVLTLDGPRGPRYEVHPGAILLARKSGLPIVPVSLNAPRRWQLRSWDQTQIPLPFSTVELRLGAPLRFPDDGTPAEDACRHLRRAMLEITRDRRA